VLRNIAGLTALGRLRAREAVRIITTSEINHAGEGGSSRAKIPQSRKIARNIAFKAPWQILPLSSLTESNISATFRVPDNADRALITRHLSRSGGREVPLDRDSLDSLWRIFGDLSRGQALGASD